MRVVGAQAAATLTTPVDEAACDPAMSRNPLLAGHQRPTRRVISDDADNLSEASLDHAKPAFLEHVRERASPRTHPEVLVPIARTEQREPPLSVERGPRHMFDRRGEALPAGVPVRCREGCDAVVMRERGKEPRPGRDSANDKAHQHHTPGETSPG